MTVINFIGFLIQIFCAKAYPQYVLKDLLTNNHAQERFRYVFDFNNDNFEVSFHQYADATSLFSILSSHIMFDQLGNLLNQMQSMLGISLTFFN